MKVIFLDFDGVLNSAASFLLEDRKNKALRGPAKKNKVKINETLCHVCTSNFQYILDKAPDVKIVISSTWREIYKLEWLQDKLASYGIDSSRVIDKTPSSFRSRGYEINQWLEDHPEVKTFVILDDNEIGDRFTDKEIVETTWPVGLTLAGVYKALKILDVKLNEDDIPV